VRILKDFAKGSLDRLGFEVKRKRPLGLRGSVFPSAPFPAQRELIRRFGRGGTAILDVGANHGQSAAAYRRQFPDADIVCFEALPGLAGELQTKFSQDSGIRIVQSAVGERRGTADFFVNELDATSSLFPRPSDGRRYYPTWAGPKHEIEVDVISIDDFVTDNGIDQIAVLKLDIQGGELDALRGAASLLGRGGVAAIYSEAMFIPHYDGAALFHEIWAYLAQFGYSLFDIYDLHRATNGQLRYGDALFVSEALRKEVLDEYPAEP
jgi:FkbM family methyltransferase